MAGRNTSIALGAQLEEFADAQVASGAYGSRSEVVRAGVRLLAERELHLERLRQLIREGEESGPAEPFDFDAFLAQMHDEHHNQA